MAVPLPEVAPGFAPRANKSVTPAVYIAVNTAVFPAVSKTNFARKEICKMENAQKKLLHCAKCGLVAEVLQPCGCLDCLKCCGEPLTEIIADTVDASREKHVPVITAVEGGVKVVVGSVAHPMTEEHHIVWIEVFNGAWLNRKYLRPGDAPEAEFYVPYKPGLVVRAYCNLHGLWQTAVK